MELFVVFKNNKSALYMAQSPTYSEKYKKQKHGVGVLSYICACVFKEIHTYRVKNTLSNSMYNLRNR